MAVIAVLAGPVCVFANPVSPLQFPALSEILVTDSGWYVEVDTRYLYLDSLGVNCLYAPLVACTTSRILISHFAGFDTCSSCTEWPTCSTTVAVNDSGYAVLSAATTRPSRETGQAFSVDTASDTVAITVPMPYELCTWKVPVSHLAPGQSLSTWAYTACIYPVATYDLTRDNSPTIGRGNDLAGTMGSIEGTVRDRNGVPMAESYVHWKSYPGYYSYRCWAVRTDSVGHYVLTLSTQEDLVLRILDAGGTRISADSVPGLHIIPDSTQHVDITLSDYPPVSGVRVSQTARQPGGLTFVPGAADAQPGLRVVFASGLAGPGGFAVTLVDLRGTVVRSQSIPNVGAGTYTVDFGQRVGAGTYLCRVACGSASAERTATLGGRRAGRSARR